MKLQKRNRLHGKNQFDAKAKFKILASIMSNSLFLLHDFKNKKMSSHCVERVIFLIQITDAIEIIFNHALSSGLVLKSTRK